MSGEHRLRAIWYPRVRHPKRGLYARIDLHREGRGRTISLHKVVAEAFHGQRPLGMDIHHKDGNPTNNHAANLEYVLPAYNETMMQVSGSRCTAEKVRAAQILSAEMKQEAVARVLRVSVGFVQTACALPIEPEVSKEKSPCR